MISQTGESFETRARGGVGDTQVMQVDLWRVLPVVGALDVVLLLLSLFVLGVGARPNTALALEACGWSPAALTVECMLAVYALCFSIFLVGAQMITLGAAGKSVHALHGTLQRHLLLPLLGTAAGGGIGAHSLWGTAAASSGDCSHLSQGLFFATVVFSYGLAAYYAFLSHRLSRDMANSTKNHVTQDAAPLVPLVPRCADADGPFHGEAAERGLPPTHHTDISDVPGAVIAEAGSWPSSLAAAEEGRRGSPRVVHSPSGNGLSQPIISDGLGITPVHFEPQEKMGKPRLGAMLDDMQPPLCIGAANGPLTSTSPRQATSEADTEVPIVSTMFKTKKSLDRTRLDSPSSNESLSASEVIALEPESKVKRGSKGSTGSESGLEPDLSFQAFEVRIQQPTTSSSIASYSQLELPSPSESFKLGSKESAARKGSKGSKDSSSKRGSKESSGVPPVPPVPPGAERRPKRGSHQSDGAASKRGSLEHPPSRRGSTETVKKRSSYGIAGQLPSRDPVGRLGRMSKIDVKFEAVFTERRSCLFDPNDLVAFDNAEVPNAAETEAVMALKRVVGTAAPSDPHGTVTATSEEEAPGLISEDSEAESEDWDPTELPACPSKFDQTPKPRCNGSILVTSGRKNLNLAGPRKSVSIKVADGVASGANSRRQSQNGRASLLDMQVIHYETSPINFNLIKIENDEKQNQARGSQAEGQSEFGAPGNDIEVPYWLLDQERAENNQNNVGATSDESDNGVTSCDESDDDFQDEEMDVVGEMSTSSVCRLSSSEAKKRVSFSAASVQEPIKKKNSHPKNEGGVSSSFWKIPMPTRKNTIMHPEVNAKGEAKRYSDSSSNGLAPPSEPIRRPSALGAFANDGVKDIGLYSVPNEFTSSGKLNDFVEVKRSSIILSTHMLKEVLKSKVDSDRLMDIQDSVQEDDPSDDNQVVLPFFTTAKSLVRKCQCSVDPATGIVIHTCMTPSTTRENTDAFTSFVCSAWGSKWGSRAHSAKGSRRNSGQKKKKMSGWSEDSEEVEEDELELGFQSKSNNQSSNKRIRNASMLAIVGSAGPAPQKHDTDAKVNKSDDSNSGSSGSDEEQPEENELSVSFKNLGAARVGDSSNIVDPDTPEGIQKVEGRAFNQSLGDSVPSNGLDEQVEQDLGHRFDLVEPWQLASILKNHELREQTLAVDVRGRDWVGGHIPLSINLHTSEILRQPESLVSQCLRNRIHHLIFTCMYSVVRARKSALAVEQAQNDAQKAGLQTYRIKISLLAGGMHAWVNHFVRISPQKSLVKDFDPECWSDGGPAQGGLVHVMDALWSSGGQKALSDALTAELSALANLRGNGDMSMDGSRRQSAASSRRASEDTSRLAIAAGGKSGAASVAGAVATGSSHGDANDANSADQSPHAKRGGSIASANDDAAQATVEHSDHGLGATAECSADAAALAPAEHRAQTADAPAESRCDVADATAESTGVTPGHIDNVVGSTVDNGSAASDVATESVDKVAGAAAANSDDVVLDN